MRGADAPRPEILTSDGTAAEFPSPETIAERAKSYEDWKHRVARPRPHGHETVVTQAMPLNWAPLRKPLAECTVALASSGGVHPADEEPFDVFSEEGDATIRRIPGDVNTKNLTVTHTHYATEDALQDINVMFPLDRLRELADQAVIGRVSSLHFGFMGFLPDPAPLLFGPIPQVARELKQRDVDIIVMTPG